MSQAQANPQAYDEAARKRLRALSLELTGLPRPDAVARLRSRRVLGAAGSRKRGLRYG